MNSETNIASSVTDHTSSTAPIANGTSISSKSNTRLGQATAKKAESNVNKNEEKNKRNRLSYARRKKKTDDAIEANDRDAIEKRNKRKEQNRLNQQFKRLKKACNKELETTVSRLKAEIVLLKQEVSNNSNEWNKEKETRKSNQTKIASEIITSQTLQTEQHDKSNKHNFINLVDNVGQNSSLTDVGTKIEELNAEIAVLKKKDNEWRSYFNKIHENVKKCTEEKRVLDQKIITLNTKIEKLEEDLIYGNNKNENDIKSKNSTIKSLHEEKIILEEKIASLMKGNEKLEQDLIDSNTKIESNIMSNNSTIKSLEDENNILKSCKDNLEDENKKLQIRLSTENQNLTRKEKSLCLTSIFGLHNPQNMCYRNVALHLLHSCSDFVINMKDTFVTKTNKTKLHLSRSIVNLFEHKSSLLVESEEYQDKTCLVIDSDQVSKSVQKYKEFSIGTVYDQNDPVEFLYYILEKISLELDLPTLTKSMFGIDFEDVWTCSDCEHSWVDKYAEKNINLSFPPLKINKKTKNIDIKKLFEHTFQDCKLENVQCRNGKCGKTNTATKSSKPVKCQNYIMIQLQRINYDANCTANWIEIPLSDNCLTIDIKTCLPNYDTSGNILSKYELIAMIVKMNTNIDEGHYVAKCKKQKSEGEFEWFTFNDDKFEVMKNYKPSLNDRKQMTFMIYKRI
jgi:hypothetical protein